METPPLGRQFDRDRQAGTETASEFIFVDGVMLPFARAAVQISNMAAGNGANVFEGLCLYSSGSCQYLFRLEDHLVNLRRSAWQMDIECDYTDEDFVEAIFASVRENRIAGDAHLRLALFITGNGPGDPSGPVSLVCTARSRTPSSVHSRAVHAAISSWRRLDDPLMPPRIRAEANSHNMRFGLLEVLRNGYDQAIFVSKAGKVGCGANASFLIVRDGCLVSPPETSETEERVIRSALLEIAAEELGLEVQEREIDRGELSYTDEAMFCGSGVEIRPVLSINKVRIGEGHVGPVTRRLWQAFEATVRGRNDSRAAWRTRLEQWRHASKKRSPHESAFSRTDLMRFGQQDRRFPRSGEIGHLLENGYQMGNSSTG